MKVSHVLAYWELRDRLFHYCFCFASKHLHIYRGWKEVKRRCKLYPHAKLLLGFQLSAQCHVQSGAAMVLMAALSTSLKIASLRPEL